MLYMRAKRQGKYFSGTSNVVVPVRNKLAYPPEFQEGTKLTYYASLFNSVEVNSTFYKLPMPRTIEKWCAEVEPEFRFTFKLWQEITHTKGQPFDPEKLARFMHVIGHAGDHKGCLLIQFPPSVTFAPMMLNALLSEVVMHDTYRSWAIAVEFRNRSWYQDTTYEMLAAHHAIMVRHDLPASSTPPFDNEDEVVYLRFHGPEGGYRGSYEDDHLYEYAGYINEWMQEGRDVYVYFNNTMGAAVHNLITLDRYVKQLSGK
ncbi:DUF72 domain-containing protein [Mucilaginibacter daejeonensis]|uniref:DUF72 domain-containing protein n=1 Tax=Mucilaginibacter daejeonensis TaxID=398049 RepID=UPI001D17023B|nr:DUF72 domain-containing protein [Mucilaginibacter daejeonensis]UEG54736.1 DUF72 domain-containing protein [Mucilaginibacter daejeonensis]